MTLTFDLSVPKTRVSDPLSNVTVPSLKSAITNRLAMHRYRQIYIETVVIAAASTDFQYGVTDACFFVTATLFSVIYVAFRIFL